MHILCVCNLGQNRSKHCANYLSQKGYETDFAGISPMTMNKVTQQRIDRADIVIPATPGIGDALEDTYDLSGKRIITLHATRDPADLQAHDAKDVYEQIEKEIDKADL